MPLQDKLHTSIEDCGTRFKHVHTCSSDKIEVSTPQTDSKVAL